MEDGGLLLDEVADSEAKPTPICFRCFALISPRQYYCQICGETVNPLTPYIPFVSIPFHVQLWAKLWYKVWYDHEAGWDWKVFGFLFITLTAPVMLLGIPFVLLAKWRARSHVEEGES